MNSGGKDHDPQAPNDTLSHPQRQASTETIQMLWDVIAGEISRSHRGCPDPHSIDLRPRRDRLLAVFQRQGARFHGASAGLSRARAAIKARFREGLVLSRSVFDWRKDIATRPVWVFLAGLHEQPMRRITFA